MVRVHVPQPGSPRRAGFTPRGEGMKEKKRSMDGPIV